MKIKELRKATEEVSIFTPGEITRIWEAKDTNIYYSVILMYIYTGCRKSELLNLKKTEVDIPGRCFKILEAKTEAGIRTVPIAEKVVPFFEYWYNLNDCEYLLSTPEGCHSNFYDKHIAPLFKTLETKRNIHDTRHTCLALLATAGVDERIVNDIVGHRNYTNLERAEMAEMLDAINKI